MGRSLRESHQRKACRCSGGQGEGEGQGSWCSSWKRFNRWKVTSYHSSVLSEKPERRLSCRKALMVMSHDKGVGERAKEGNIVGHLRKGEGEGGRVRSGREKTAQAFWRRGKAWIVKVGWQKGKERKAEKGWCRGRDLNPHGLIAHWLLRPARLPSSATAAKGVINFGGRSSDCQAGTLARGKDK
jgi:hypothetical protein